MTLGGIGIFGCLFISVWINQINGPSILPLAWTILVVILVDANKDLGLAIESLAVDLGMYRFCAGVNILPSLEMLLFHSFLVVQNRITQIAVVC